MPIWSEILHELNESGATPDFDAVRRKYLVAVHQHTGRNVILYASNWTQATSPYVAIGPEDLQGLMQVVHGLQGPDLDLILYSPGGSVAATEAMVCYLRSKFSHIRVIVPNMALSAAAMLACSADRIVMGKHSFLGPTDPQLLLRTPLGARWVPVQAILEQFARAKSEWSDSSVWLPMLTQYGPDLVVQCENVDAMARSLLRGWLRDHMFRELPDRNKRARRVAKWLSSNRRFGTHNRPIGRRSLRNRGLVIDNLEADEALQDTCLSVFHATTLTFGSTAVVKLIENHLGRAFMQTSAPMP